MGVQAKPSRKGCGRSLMRICAGFVSHDILFRRTKGVVDDNGPCARISGDTGRVCIDLGNAAGNLGRKHR